MNSWLITWEFVGRESDIDKITAILSSRKSERYVAEFMELLYLRSTCSAGQMAYYANRQKRILFKAQRGLLINEIPHEGILCGSSSCWLYARKVRNLKICVDKSKTKEIISWVEPLQYKWKDGGRSIIELESEGTANQWERDCSKPLSKDTW